MCFRKYYTDVHDVDENETTIADQGGTCSYDITTGIACRFMGYISSSTLNVVASKNNVQPPSKLGGYVMYYITFSLG